jgi:cysteine sulfinate desulfinase/cysteine desulfurase-like protein
VGYLSQQVQQLLLNGVHLSTGLAKSAGSIRQTGLLEALSQALTQQLRNSWRV